MIRASASGRSRLGIAHARLGGRGAPFGFRDSRIGCPGSGLGFGQAGFGLGHPGLGVRRSRLRFGHPGLGVRRPRLRFGHPRLGGGCLRLRSLRGGFELGDPRFEGLTTRHEAATRRFQLGPLLLELTDPLVPVSHGGLAGLELIRELRQLRSGSLGGAQGGLELRDLRGQLHLMGVLRLRAFAQRGDRRIAFIRTRAFGHELGLERADPGGTGVLRLRGRCAQLLGLGTDGRLGRLRALHGGLGGLGTRLLAGGSGGELLETLLGSGASRNLGATRFLETLLGLGASRDLGPARFLQLGQTGLHRPRLLLELRELLSDLLAGPARLFPRGLLRFQRVREDGAVLLQRALEVLRIRDPLLGPTRRVLFLLQLGTHPRELGRDLARSGELLLRLRGAGVGLPDQLVALADLLIHVGQPAPGLGQLAFGLVADLHQAGLLVLELVDRRLQGRERGVGLLLRAPERHELLLHLVRRGDAARGRRLELYDPRLRSTQLVADAGQVS